MTGKYPHRIGMQHEVIRSHQPWGLGMDQKLLPQYFKEAGYATHAIGKWHLGFFQQQYTPTRRGFDTFFGHYGVAPDYYERTEQINLDFFPNSNFSAGYDFRNNLEVDRSDPGMYVTDLLTKRTVEIIESSDEKPFLIYLAHTAVHKTNNKSNPLPTKEEDLELYGFIENIDRRQYAGKFLKLYRCSENFRNLFSYGKVIG
jgi:arylsulfatase A-like enzyme